MRKYIGIIILAAILAGSNSACAGQLRVYDSPRQDYHRWDRAEDRYYRLYLSERRLPYIEFRRLNRRDQERYWEWRHSRRDPRYGDRDRGRYRGRDRDSDRDRDWDRR
jgi:hypothetical protein